MIELCTVLVAVAVRMRVAVARAIGVDMLVLMIVKIVFHDDYLSLFVHGAPLPRRAVLVPLRRSCV